MTEGNGKETLGAMCAGASEPTDAELDAWTWEVMHVQLSGMLPGDEFKPSDIERIARHTARCALATAAWNRPAAAIRDCAPLSPDNAIERFCEHFDLEEAVEALCHDRTDYADEDGELSVADAVEYLRRILTRGARK